MRDRRKQLHCRRHLDTMRGVLRAVVQSAPQVAEVALMRIICLSLTVVFIAASSVSAAKDDVWILGIDHIDNQGSFTTYAGAGYSGVLSSGYPQFVGNAYYRNGFDGVARVYWQLSGNAIVNGQASGNPVPTTTELYKIEFWGTTAPGNNDWQPIEGDFNGSAPGDGEAQMDPAIPWQGEYGTNHQWIAADHKTPNAWSPTGPGPHTPASASYNAASNGLYMWLTSGSWLYAKWNFPFNIGKSWSAIRLTQATPLPGQSVTGDYNKNGTVDAADYLVWRSSYGSAGANLPADGFPDGFIDEYDYDVWRERFGRTSGAGSGMSESSAVPEPGALMLVATTIASAVIVRRRGNHIRTHHQYIGNNGRDL
jgi:hypothetical protein